MMHTVKLRRTFLISAGAALSLLLVSCGGGSGGGTTGPAASSFSIGGAVAGLSGGSSVVLASGLDQSSVSANGSFNFQTSLARDLSH